MEYATVKIEDELSGKTVAQVMRTVLSMSERRISALKRVDRGILLNDSEVYTIARVHSGDTLNVCTDDICDTRKIKPIYIPLDILYEDEYFLVVNKPAGISVHPTIDPDEITLEHALAYYLKKTTVSHPVSRLDRGTSGLMTVAKSGYIHELFKKQMHTDAFYKEYRGIVEGKVEPETGTIDKPIASSKESHFKRETVKNGKQSLTAYATVSFDGKYSLLSLIPYTGRTHQLRVHLSSIGYPLVGDFLYGTENRKLIDRPALHSYYLRMTHPVTGKVIEIICDLPEDMKKIMEQRK